jgi:hypothetical protein
MVSSMYGVSNHHIPYIPDPQAKHLILKYSFSQNISFLLRTINPSLCSHLISSFTEAKRSIFSSVIGRTVSDITWNQCLLPVSLGGLGYGDSTLSSPVSSIASIHSSLDELQHLSDIHLIPQPQNIKKIRRFLSSLQLYNNFINPNPTSDNPHIRVSDLNTMSSSGHLQSALMSKLKQFSVNKFTSQLKQSLSSNFQAIQRRIIHFSSLSGELSSQWLSKCPTSEDFTFTSSQFKILLAKRLSIPTHTYVPGSKCKCKKSLDDDGSHISSSCSVGGSLHNTHNSVLRVIDQAAKSHGLNSTL